MDQEKKENQTIDDLVEQLKPLVEQMKHYPDSIAFYIMEYRKEYDPESLAGTEYEYLLHEEDFNEEQKC